LAARIEGATAVNPHAKLVAADIRRWQGRSTNTELGPMLQVPPGDPI
jgi:hypothetical protein